MGLVLADIMQRLPLKDIKTNLVAIIFLQTIELL